MLSMKNSSTEVCQEAELWRSS